MLRSLQQHSVQSTLLVASAAVAVGYSWKRSHDGTKCADIIAGASPWTPIRLFRPNDSLEIAFDVRSRTPVYVLERLSAVSDDTDDDNDDTASSSTKTQKKKQRPRFYEEKSLPEVFRSRNSQYHGSGLDRGHLAPAADFSSDEKLLKDTFNLINVAPQNPTMNRTLWLALEDWTRRVVRKHTTKATYVVTGPLWLPQRQLDQQLFEYRYQALGVPPSLVSVPTHFFKVVAVVDEDKDQIVEFACFVMPNTEPGSSTDLRDYLVGWTDLEAVSGLELFPAWTDDAFRLRANQCTHQLLLSRPSSQTKKPLLLTADGSSPKSSSSKVFSMSRHPVLQHLCRNGQCFKR